MIGRRLLPRFKSLWLCEALRNKEATGSIADEAALRAMAHDPEASEVADESLIFRRAGLLGQTNDVVKALSGNIDFVMAGARAALAALSVLALLLGLAAPAALLARGDTINIVLAWVTLLGPHLASLLLIALASVFRLKSGKFSLASLWLWLTERIGRKRDGVFLVESLGAFAGRSRGLPWLVMGVSHFLWNLFFLGVLASLVVSLMFHEYSFAWKTTILPTAFFIGFVEFTGWIPAQLGFAVPDAATVAALSNGDTVRKAWSAWLLGSIVIYGLVPRILLFIVALRISRNALARLRLDVSKAYYVALLQRIRAVTRPRTVIIDPDPGPGPLGRTGIPAAPHPAGTHASTSGVLVPFELGDDVIPSLSSSGHGLRRTANIVQEEDQDAVLHELRSLGVQRVVVVFDAMTTADRGAFQFLDAVRQECSAVRVLLLHQDVARKDKVANWKDGFAELGLASDARLLDMGAVRAWLAEGATDEP